MRNGDIRAKFKKYTYHMWYVGKILSTQGRNWQSYKVGYFSLCKILKTVLMLAIGFDMSPNSSLLFSFFKKKTKTLGSIGSLKEQYRTSV